MIYNRNFDFTAGTEIIADQVDLEFNTIQGVLNGNIDTDNIKSGAIDIEKFASSVNPETRLSETSGDFVLSGLLLDPASGWGAAQLTASITAGVAYISGRRVSTSTQTDHAFTASKDTYIDLDYNGTFYYTEVTLGAAEPSLGTNRHRLAKVVTDTVKITTYTDKRTLRAGEWRNWTPSVAFAGAASQTSTMAGAYCQIGKTVHFRGSINVTTGANFAGLVSVTVTAPFTGKKPAGAYYAINSQVMFWNINGSGHQGVCLALGTDTTFTTFALFAGSVSGASLSYVNVTSLVPFTWEIGDWFYFVGTYEAA